MRRYLTATCMLLSVSLANAQPEIRKRLQTELIMAENGDTIRIPEGVFSIDATLSMEGKDHIVIAGAGIDQTILSFKGQVSGAEGIRITNGKHITICDMTIRDAKGDGIKTMNLEDVRFIRLRADWSGKPSKKNGAYGLYPVNCEGVLIDSCIARGASDAGIYVGQSAHIVVRNCKAYENVAGIEIENSMHADVYGNEAFHNTGGILVFDLPDLPVKRGGYTKVHHNKVYDNNTANFAPKGNIVGTVPQGTGIILLAANHVDVSENEIRNNRTLGVCIGSYYLTENRIRDTGYYPYPTAISIHDNIVERKKVRATMRGRIGKLYRFKLRFGRQVPDIVYDGILDEKLTGVAGLYPEALRICIRNNRGARFAALDAANDFKSISMDLTGYDCHIPVSVDAGKKPQ